MKPVYDQVTAALVELLDMADASQISAQTRLEEDLGIDSGLLLELFMLVEERVPGAVIDPSELRPEQFSTVASFVALIESHVRDAAGVA
ncbi:MAG: acyl carrier protein [Paracoccaceae bacterium]